MRGMLIEKEGKENETRHVYNFIVQTTLGIYSVQCDASPGPANVKQAVVKAQKGESGSQTSLPSAVEIVATYPRRSDCELDAQMALLTCFSQGDHRSKALLGLLEDKD